MATYGASSQASSQTSPYNIARPTGVVAGTYMVAAIANDVENNGSGIGITGGSTWNSLTSGLTEETGYRLFWKIAGGSEPANYSVSYNSGSNAYSIAHIITSNDAGTSAPVWQVTNTAGSGTTGPTPGITPPDATALEVRFILASNSSGGARTWTSPGGLTERTDINESGFTNGSSATRTLASGSATTSLNFTASGTVNDRVGITVGIPSGATEQTVSPGGIASGEAFGTARLSFTVRPSGIASEEAFGGLVISTPEPQFITAEGIASGEAFGTLTTRLYIGASGIASGEAFGSPRLAALIGPSGIPSGEAFGTTNVAIEQFISPTGVTSGAAFGVAALQIGYPQTIEVVGIESRGVVEDPYVRNLHRLLLVNPSIQETPAAWDRLNVRFGIHRGITIIKDADGVWSSVRYPAQTEIEAAQKVFLGGRRHDITPDEADELTDAGYGSYITLEPA
jgi:hypothetical protein